MKRALLLAGALLLATAAMAGNVNGAAARRVAVNFMKSMGYGTEAEALVDMTAAAPFGELYVFVGGDGRGFVLVAADDRTDPIVGYSLDSRFPVGNLPPQAVVWLHGCERAIEANARMSQRDAAVASQWRTLLDGGALPNTEKAYVRPLLATTWNQSPLYNALCPYDTVATSLVPAGCTAIATTQIMKYYNYPAQGYGSECYTHPVYGEQCADYGNTVYVWDSMPEALNGGSSEAQVAAVSTLVYHLGVAVNMDYGPSGSGGPTCSYGYGGMPSSENALKYNFGYSPYIYTAFQADYTLAEWKQLMKNELNAGRPVLYAGYDVDLSGHAFVCDGYDVQGKFHFNWGWGGGADGYFNLETLNPRGSVGGSSYHFDLLSTATIGIAPYADFGGATTVNVSMEGLGGVSLEGCTVTGAGSYAFGDTITMLALAGGDAVRFAGWSDGCRFNPRLTVATGGEVSFTALFAPLRGDTLYYVNSFESVLRDVHADPTLGTDSVWGIRLPAAALKAHHNLTGIEFKGRDTAEYVLTVYSGNDSPEQVLYTDTFEVAFPYTYSWHNHTLATPVVVDGNSALWVALKCTTLERPGVFSIYGGHDGSLLVGENLELREGNDLYSWIIRCFFEPDGTGIEAVDTPASLAVWPNPATGTVWVRADGATGKAQLQLLDLGGRAVLTQTVTDAAEPASVDVSRLPCGVYFLRLTASEGVHVGKITVR